MPVRDACCYVCNWHTAREVLKTGDKIKKCGWPAAPVPAVKPITFRMKK